MSESYTLGKEGEKQAAAYLLEKGYTILEKNYRFGKAELDIIAETHSNIVIVEVKTRSTDYFELPSETVTPSKISHLVRAANHYIVENQIDKEARFDIISIVKQNNLFQITHLERAFHYF